MGNGISHTLSSKLSVVLAEMTSSKPQVCHTLCRSLKRSLRYIRRYCRKISRYTRHSTADRWLMDHFPAMERAGETTVKLLRTVRLRTIKSCGLPDTFLFLKAALDTEGFHFTDQTVQGLITLFEGTRSLTNAEHDYLPELMRAAAISLLGDMLCPAEQELSPERVERFIQTLSEVGQLDGERFAAEGNQLERLLSGDPTGIYSRQNDRTRALYRYQVSRAAELAGTDELTAGKKLLAKATQTGRHIGFAVADYYQQERRKNPLVSLHFKLLFFMPGVASILLSGAFGNPLWALLFYWPFFELCRPVLERFVRKGGETFYAPRLSWKDGVPEEFRTLVAVSTLLPGTGEAELTALREKLEDMAMTNGRGAVGFCLLCDLKAASEPDTPEDKPALAVLRRLITELNRRFDNRFVLLVRERRYSNTQREYTGWERKRGAITELIGLKYGKDTALAEFCGNTDLIYCSRYLLTLDYDTGLTIGAVEELAAVAAHPVNRPVMDRERGIVTSGYGIIAPRMVLDLKSSLRSRFSRMMGGIGGLSSYDASGGELYQDLYGVSIFSGKGLIDMEAYHQLMPGLFEEETVLSHDILEGSFLRTLFVGDVELTDGFPADGIGFFKRLHRWIRGDFQNTPFLFPTVRLGNRTTPLGDFLGVSENPLRPLSRYQLFDNLRRALTPAFAVACLLGAAFLGDWRRFVLGALALLSASAPLLYSLWRMVASGAFAAMATRFYSAVLPKSAELLCRALLTVALLPQLAWTGLDAACRGLYRRFVSHRHMLEWNPAASAGKGLGGGRKSLLSQAAFYMAQWVTGVLCLLGGLLPIGLLFWLAVPFVLFASREAKEKVPCFSVAEKERLLEDTRKMLRYYDDFATEGEHFLPPDNVQQAPAQRVAHRTSPTNIGLMLLSWLTAWDLGLLSAEGLREKTERVLATLEGLEKFHGNLYNWYDTESLRVLPPGFVSAVDSGNLLCCLTAFKEGLRELEESHPALKESRRRTEALIREADLSVFYDRKRNLFSIGWDAPSETLNSSHYDMLMSEARMMSYFAIATGQAPLRHWAALSRTLSRKGCHTGPMSWTGTMFEYYMPELLLHSVRGSIGYEALSYCLACQKRRTRRMRIASGEGRVPWGISESGIFSFDTQLNYQYSPNGVQKLALKRGMDEELVVSPYSSYLALSRDPEGVLQNLALLSRLGACGKYGFYEAVDFTRSRTGGNAYELIKSQMAHHLGMSITAVGNALSGNRMQKRFLRDPQMRAARELLCEKLPVGEIIMSDYLKRKLPQPPQREPDEPVWLGSPVPWQPKVKLLSNTDMTCVATDLGASFLRSGRTDLTRRPSDLLRGSVGSFCFVQTAGTMFSLTSAPSYQKDVTYGAAFSPTTAIYTAEVEPLSARMEVKVSRSMPCEQRTVTLQNRSGESQEYTLLFYLEPSLFPREDDESHKSFSKLFLQLEQDKKEQAVIASRRKRGTEELFWLATGFREELSWDLLSSREQVFARPDISRPCPEAFTCEVVTPEDRPFFAPDPCIAFRIRLKLQRDETRCITLLTAIGRSRHEALSYLRDGRSNPPLDSDTAVRTRFREGSLEQRIAQVVLPEILFHRRDTDAIPLAAAKNRLGVDSLWQFGVSGDFPILLCDISVPDDFKRVASYTVCHSLMKLSFVDCDLLFVYEGGENTATALREAVEQHCQPGALGARAGVHLIDRERLSTELETLLRAAACHIADGGCTRTEVPVPAYELLRPLPLEPLPLPLDNDIRVCGGVFRGESFFCGETGAEQSHTLPWCHILANPVFGTLASDKALGFSWAINSRQNKLTPWFNDPMRDNSGEQMLLREGNTCWDLVNGSRAEFCPNYLRYEGTTGGREPLDSCTTVTVPRRGMVKYLETTLYNPGDSERWVELCYYTEPCLHVTREDSCQISGELVEDVLLLRNPWNRSLPAFLGLWAEGEAFSFACDRPAFLCGQWNQNQLPPCPDLCAALIVKKCIRPGERVTVRFTMAFATTENGVLAQRRLTRMVPAERQWPTENRLRVHSGDAAVDALVNTWLPWQALASRIWGRTGFYQNGGAYGFRDQLQDVISLLPLSPALARRQILRCCAVQFEAGDVMHWWHPLPKGHGERRGVRTRYSDDPVWLVWAVGEYVERTGDEDFLRLPVAYLVAEELAEGQKDCYLQAVPTGYRESVWEHCKRAVSRARNFGSHGLPKIGGGDWNDGYSKVGSEGKGESVWLGQFLSMALQSASTLAGRMGEPETAAEYEETARELLRAIDRTAFDGSYYLRAFYDDGFPMGSHKNRECRIDSLPQSFAVLSGMPDQERLDMAMQAALTELTDDKAGILRLFTPAFQGGTVREQNPGYVQSYPEGIRENGGQYTHAAVWFAMAAKENGMQEDFYRLTELLNPIRRCQEPDAARRYGLEPFWIAADIYTNEDAYGRGGWSMYTGSAGWYYRLLTETLLGLTLRDGAVTVCLPQDLEGAVVEYESGESK